MGNQNVGLIIVLNRSHCYRVPYTGFLLSNENLVRTSIALAGNFILHSIQFITTLLFGLFFFLAGTVC